MTRTQYTDNTVKFFISIIGLVVIALVLKELSHIFIPLFIAIFLFFVFSPLNIFLMKKKVPAFLITLLDLFLIGIIFYGAGKVTIDSLIGFGNGLPVYTGKLNQIVRDFAANLNIDDPFLKNFSVENLLRKLNYENLAGGFLTSTVNLAGSVLFVLFFFVFVVSGEKTIYEAIKNYYVHRKVKPHVKRIKKTLSQLPVENEKNIDLKLLNEKLRREKDLAQTFNTIIEQIQKYVIAKVGINLLAGIITGISLSLTGINYPVVWGLFVFLFNFIPTIGSAIALIFPVLFAFVQFDSTSPALLIALIMATIQTLAFNLAEPMIIGRRLNLNPLLILLSVLIWGYIWGIVGMLMAVPIMAVIKIILANTQSDYLKFLSNLMSKSGTI